MGIAEVVFNTSFCCYNTITDATEPLIKLNYPLTTKITVLFTFFILMLISRNLYGQRGVEQDFIRVSSDVSHLSLDVSGTSDFDNPLFKYHWYFINKFHEKPSIAGALFSFSPTKNNDCLK